MKVAIVCDWLTSVGGAEHVLKAITELFPDAPIYTSQYNKKKINWFNNSDVRVGWLQIFPSSFRKLLGPLRQKYFSHLDLSSYDLIISVTGAEAKAVKKGNALHLCYCHVPTQYYWGLKDDYLKNPGFGILNPLARLGLKLFLKPLKKADYESAQLPDAFITISTYSQEEIKKAYGRDSTIIFPPVAVEKFSTDKLSTNSKTTKNEQNQDEKTEQNKLAKNERYGFVVTSRQVNWKRIDLAVKACELLKLPLTVIGEGPEHKKLVKLAKKSRLIKFLPLTDQNGLKKHLEKAEGYIFPSLEPFGIAPVEALACGCPVVAYGKGGALDYVIDGENGVLFGKQSVNSLRQAIKRFKTIKFNEEKIKASALPFSEQNFKENLKSYVVKEVKAKREGKDISKTPAQSPTVQLSQISSSEQSLKPLPIIKHALPTKPVKTVRYADSAKPLKPTYSQKSVISPKPKTNYPAKTVKSSNVIKSKPVIKTTQLSPQKPARTAPTKLTSAQKPTQATLAKSVSAQKPNKPTKKQSKSPVQPNKTASTSLPPQSSRSTKSPKSAKPIDFIEPRKKNGKKSSSFSPINQPSKKQPKAPTPVLSKENQKPAPKPKAQPKKDESPKTNNEEKAEEINVKVVFK